MIRSTLVVICDERENNTSLVFTNRLASFSRRYMSLSSSTIGCVIFCWYFLSNIVFTSFLFLYVFIHFDTRSRSSFTCANPLFGKYSRTEPSRSVSRYCTNTFTKTFMKDLSSPFASSYHVKTADRTDSVCSMSSVLVDVIALVIYIHPDIAFILFYRCQKPPQRHWEKQAYDTWVSSTMNTAFTSSITTIFLAPYRL